VIDRSGQIGFNAEVLTEGSVGDARCRRRVLAVVDALTVGANSVDLAGALIALDLDHSALALAALLEMSLCNTNESDVK
jgi:hypothetical protein